MRYHFINILLCFTVMSSIPIAAQEVTEFPTPCNPCKFAQRAWSEIPATYTVVSIGVCSYRVWYKKRLCSTDGCQEIKIEKIEPFPEPAPPECTEWSSDELVTIVLGKMVEGNLMGFQPDTVGLGSSACWRIIRPACWSLNVDTTNCTWWPTGGSDTTDNRVNYQDGEYVPCDTNNCCTHMLFPTRDACGDIFYNTPQPSEYIWLLSLRTVPEDSADLVAYDDAIRKLMHQFDGAPCIPCNPGAPPSPPLPPLLPPHCINHCKRDLMMEYRKLINEKLEELYGE